MAATSSALPSPQTPRRRSSRSRAIAVFTTRHHAVHGASRTASQQTPLLPRAGRVVIEELGGRTDQPLRCSTVRGEPVVLGENVKRKASTQTIVKHW